MIFNIYLKKYIPKVVVVFAFSIALFSNSVLAQKVTIEDILQKDKKVYVYYTLAGNSVYEVKLYYVLGQVRHDWKRAYKLSGDVGDRQKGSKNIKLMVWDVLSEKSELVGKCDFKIIAIDTNEKKKLDKENIKKTRQAAINSMDQSILYSSNLSRSPFGLSVSGLRLFDLLPGNTKFGLFVDVKTDFGLYAYSTWEVRPRSWLNGSYGYDAASLGENYLSPGGTDYSICGTYLISGAKRKRSSVLLGINHAVTPYYEKFYWAGTTRYIKSTIPKEIDNYLIFGLTSQNESGLTYGFSFGISTSFKPLETISLYIGQSLN